MMDASRVAMVFAHPGHEVLVAGMMQRYRPHLLFLTQADSGGHQEREEWARQGLDVLGLADRATYLGMVEPHSYHWALTGNVSPYLKLRDRILDWLRAVRPTAVAPCSTVPGGNTPDRPRRRKTTSCHWCAVLKPRCGACTIRNSPSVRTKYLH